MEKFMKPIKTISDEIETETQKVPENLPEENLKHIVSTGSTLLNLAILGGRVRGGGIPTGIFVEIYGPEASGKTALLAEIAASTQNQGGEAKYLDVEGRLDREYARIYGMNITEDSITRIETIPQFFESIKEWAPAKGDVANTILADSLAALALEGELVEEDKMAAARRANKFSEGLRKVKAILSQSNRLLVCSNQVRETIETMGFGTKEKAPGGRAIAHYASLRIKVSPSFKESKIEYERKYQGVPHKKIVGIMSECTITKSTVDDPYRKAIIPIIFGYGIDDVRGNLVFLKNKIGSYTVGGKETAKYMEKAIENVEKNNLQEQLKEEVIILWEQIESLFKTERSPKIR